MKLKLRLSVQVTMKGKIFRVNLNDYRNAHFRTLDKAKKEYTKLVIEDNADVLRVLQRPVHVVFTLYPKTKRLMDLDNMLTIVCKFTNDALTKHGYIPDDNYSFIKSLYFRFGAVDKVNPRVEAEYTEIQED